MVIVITNCYVVDKSSGHSSGPALRPWQPWSGGSGHTGQGGMGAALLRVVWWAGFEHRVAVWEKEMLSHFYLKVHLPLALSPKANNSRY